MPDRRTQSYAAVPHYGTWIVGTVIESPGTFRQLPPNVWPPLVIETDPPDPVPELPPSPTFWPRDEPKEPGR